MKPHLAIGLVTFMLAPIFSCSDDETAVEEQTTATTTEAPAAPAANEFQQEVTESQPATPVEEEKAGKTSENQAAPTQTQTQAQPQKQEVVEEGPAYVITGALNVRSGPGVSHPVVDTLTYRKKVSILKGGTWTKIGMNQYVYGAYLSSTMPTSPLENPIVVEPPQ